MCGINGIIQKDNSFDILKDIQEMNNQIYHRGPDDDGVYIFKNKIALGMRRLSIIDLSGGKQPITNETDSIILVFNGEIYNYQELRKDLVNEGIQFKTKSDTEVVLKLYEKFGKDCLKYLNGMFAFSIYDKNNHKIFIARDRVGEKPLFFYKNNGQCIWASELKSIVSIVKSRNKKLTISKKAISLYFSLSFIPAPYTIYEEVIKLTSGSYIEIDTNTIEYKITKYWDVKLQENGELIRDYSIAKKKLKDILYDSVEKRMIADVPLGVFLSGGIDSSIITSIMADIKGIGNVKTFTIGVDNKDYDESQRAEVIAKQFKTDHECVELNFNEIRENIDHIIANYDEPFADSSALPTYFVSKMARNKVKVALTGDGGDEVFGGYERYLMGNYAQKYKNIVPNILHQSIIKPFINSISQSKENRYSYLTKIRKVVNSIGNNQVEEILSVMSLSFNKEDKTQLLTNAYNEDLLMDLLHESIENVEKIPNLSYLTKARYIDKNISLDGDMLVKVDRASMLASLECRAPFLDHRLFEFTNQLPDDFLIKGLDKKHILKDTFKDLLPNNFLNLPKKGFAIPIGTWLRESLRNEVLVLTDKDYLTEQGIFNEKYVSKIVREHLNYLNDHSFKIWSIYCFQKWFKAQI